ncbi:MAG TPA: DUF47 family protein [Solirubrobacteraceae bacterium]|nr:DUF47 family protein [Solirubrobacteraceae bacterium]
MSPRSDEVTLASLLADAGSNVERASRVLRDLLAQFPEHAPRARELSECERKGDRITHDIIHRLATSRRLREPFGAGDGYALATAIDDVVDYVEQAAAQLDLYGVEAPMEQAAAFAEVLVAASGEISSALRELYGDEDLSPHLVEIHRLENEGDRLQRDAVASLFAGGIDPMVVIRWKDIFESLEGAVDACETVAHVLEGIALKRGGS